MPNSMLRGAAALTLLLLAACRTPPEVSQLPPVVTEPPATASATPSGAGGAETTPASTAGVIPGTETRVIYFDFDASEIRLEFAGAIGAHARALGGNASIRVRLEGHTDERGSREYNIGLAERRSQAVRRALGLQGARDAQLSTVSYGEERPAQAGQSEEAWAKNRRVEIVYLN